MTLSLDQRRNVIAFVCGRKGSGKSTILHDLFTAQAPRVLSLDATGETVERNPDAVRTFGLDQTLDALHAAAGWQRWHLAASLEADEVPQLFALLAPRIVAEDTVGLSLLLGGIAVECGEADTIAPNGKTAPQVADAWRRGRHHCLSLLMGTQRPASCDRLLTSQADYIVAFQQPEPRDKDFLARAISKPVAELVGTLPQFWCVWYRSGDVSVRVLDERRRVRRVVGLDGAELPADAAK